jgi:hypothetical protein
VIASEPRQLVVLGGDRLELTGDKSRSSAAR